MVLLYLYPFDAAARFIKGGDKFDRLSLNGDAKDVSPYLSRLIGVEKGFD